MDADLDTLLIALYVELADHIIPGRDLRTGRGPGRPPLVTDAEIVCLAVAQVLLRFYDVCLAAFCPATRPKVTALARALPLPI